LVQQVDDTEKCPTGLGSEKDAEIWMKTDGSTGANVYIFQ